MKEVIIRVQGMMCTGCENRIKNSLESIKGIKKVLPEYEKGTVTISMKQEIPVDLIEQTIENIGFKVVKEG